MKAKNGVVVHGAGTETAYLTIRELIVSGRLAPGSWIVESDLATKLGMSRTPIRAALQWLQHEGYVVARESGTKSSVNVAPLTLQDAIELYAIVGHIEGIAGRRTASISESKRKTLVVALKKLNDRLTKMVNASKVPHKEFAAVDTTFHDTLVEAGAGSRLLTIYNAIKPQADRYWRLYSSSIPTDFSVSISEHSKIIEAIAAGDGKATERALQVNWEKGAARLTRMITHFGERGNWWVSNEDS